MSEVTFPAENIESGAPPSDEGAPTIDPAWKKISQAGCFAIAITGGIAGIPSKKKRRFSPICADSSAPPEEIAPASPSTPSLCPAPQPKPLATSPRLASPLLAPAAAPQSLQAALPLLPPVAAPLVQEPPSLDLSSTIRKPFECTQRDRDQIREVVLTLSKGKTHTILNASLLRSYDAQMNSPKGSELHSFLFLDRIFGDPELSSLMPAIFKDLFLRKGFMEGVNRGMNREAERNNLEPLIGVFAEKLRLPEKKIREIIQSVMQQRPWWPLQRDWTLLVELIMRNGAPLPREPSQE